MEETVFVVSVAKVYWQPMSNFFIVGSQVARFLNECLNGDVVEECFSILDQASPWDFRYIEAKTELVLFKGEFGVEAHQFFTNDINLIFNCFKLLDSGLLVVESRPKG